MVESTWWAGPPVLSQTRHRYLEGQQVALQAVSDENGVSAEHAQQDGLHIPQCDARVHEVGLCHP